MIEQRPGQKVFTVPGPDWGVRVIQSAAAAYYQKVLSYGPIAYWPIWDALGSGTAEELVNSPAQDGAHTNVTCGQPGIGDGRTSGWYDGPGGTSFTNIFTALFQATFDGGEGTAMVWARVNAVGVWTDGAFRYALGLRNTVANRLILRKNNAANSLSFFYVAGGVSRSVTLTPVSDLGWMHLAFTWSASTPPTGEMRAYYNGAQTGATQVGLGVWVGNLAADHTCIGAANITPTVIWHGWLAHVAVWDSALAPAAIADLATV